MSAPEVPTYLTEEGSTQEVVLDRLLDLMEQAGYDRTEGEFAWDFNSPLASEQSIIGIALRYVLQVGFAQTSFGDYLTLRASERGVDRRSATGSTGVVRFTAAAFTTIPYHTVVATLATPSAPAQMFQTDVEASVPALETSVDVACTALIAGTTSNVPQNSVRLLSSPAPGVTQVTNPLPFVGGADDESDAALFERYMVTVRSSSTGGNRADHVRWATEVPGVGGANVSYPSEGTPPVQPGGVRVAIVDSARNPASLTLQRAVYDKIVDPKRIGPYEAEGMTLSGFGATVDATQPDDTVSSVRMIYNAGGNGQITQSLVHTLLGQPGIWTVKVRAKVSSAAGSSNLVFVGVWSVSGAAYTPASPGAAPATSYFQANDLATAFPENAYEDAWLSHDFYWNGLDQLQLHVVRLVSETTTQVWVDRVAYVSVFSDAAGDGLAPAGQRVEVRAASPVSVNVSAALIIASGFTRASVEDQIEANLTAYLQTLTFGTQNDVQYARVGTVILDTPGVSDYSVLTVNGGVGNVPINSEQVAVLGTATWS